MTQPDRIDVHAHDLAPAYVDALRSAERWLIGMRSPRSSAATPGASSGAEPSGAPRRQISGIPRGSRGNY